MSKSSIVVMCCCRGDISAIAPTENDKSTYTENLELYVLRQDLTVNPIPERADALREQAAEEGGLCNIKIPAYEEDDTTSKYLDTVVASVTSSPNCTIDVCRSEGCHVCTDEGVDITCTQCADSDECDGLENVKEYRFCDCDAVVTVNKYNEFELYTGKNECIHDVNVFLCCSVP